MLEDYMVRWNMKIGKFWQHSHIETKLQINKKDGPVKIKISYSKIHGASGDGSVFVNLIWCCKDYYNEFCNALQIDYGNNRVNKDEKRQQMKIVPMLTTRQWQFEQNTILLRNLRPHDAIIHLKNLEDQKTYDLTMLEFLQNFTDEDNHPIFSAVD